MQIIWNLVVRHCGICIVTCNMYTVTNKMKKHLWQRHSYSHKLHNHLEEGCSLGVVVIGNHQNEEERKKSNNPTSTIKKSANLINPHIDN